MVAEATNAALKLPMAVVTQGDVGRLMQEIESIDNFIRQADLQNSSDIQLPKTSRLFNDLVSINRLDMREGSHRYQVAQLLQVVREKAPVLHMSFNIDPSPIFTERLMTWLRQHIHPFVLLQVGLLPNIGAGCMLRTTNKYYDFSLRQRFTDTKPLLIAKLSGGTESVVPDVALVVPETTS